MYASLGLIALTKEKAEEIISELVKKGEMTNEEGKKTLEAVLSRIQDEGEKLKVKMQDQIENTLMSMNVAKASDLVEIYQRLEKLEKKVDALYNIEEA